MPAHEKHKAVTHLHKELRKLVQHVQDIIAADRSLLVRNLFDHGLPADASPGLALRQLDLSLGAVVDELETVLHLCEEGAREALMPARTWQLGSVQRHHHHHHETNRSYSSWSIQGKVALSFVLCECMCVCVCVQDESPAGYRIDLVYTRAFLRARCTKANCEVSLTNLDGSYVQSGLQATC